MALLPTDVEAFVASIEAVADKQIAANTAIANNAANSAAKISEANERVAVYTAVKTQAEGFYTL